MKNLGVLYSVTVYCLGTVVQRYNGDNRLAARRLWHAYARRCDHSVQCDIIEDAGTNSFEDDPIVDGGTFDKSDRV